MIRVYNVVDQPSIALCSWGHMTTILLKMLYIMGYNLKNAYTNALIFGSISAGVLSVVY